MAKKERQIESQKLGPPTSRPMSDGLNSSLSYRIEPRTETEKQSRNARYATRNTLVSRDYNHDIINCNWLFANKTV